MPIQTQFPITFNSRHSSLTYTQRLMAIERAALFHYTPLSEPLGAATAIDLAGIGSGAYGNVTLGVTGVGDERTAARFNGATSYCNIYSAGFASRFNPTQVTVSAFARVADANVWTDGVARTILRISTDGNNRLTLLKATANNTLSVILAGGGTFKTYTIPTDAPLGWFHLVATVDGAANEFRVYLNGMPLNLQHTVPTWSGALSATGCYVGAGTAAGSAVWKGDIAHVAAWDTVLTPAQALTVGSAPYTETIRLSAAADAHTQLADDPNYDADYADGRDNSVAYVAAANAVGYPANLLIGDQMQSLYSATDCYSVFAPLANKYAAMGNHDAGFAGTADPTDLATITEGVRVGLGMSALWYAFDVGSFLRVIVLNSALGESEDAIDGLYEGSLGTAQLAWLEDEIAASTSYAGVLVLIHHPPVANTPSVFDAADITALGTILNSRRHVWVLSGHMHPVALTHYTLGSAVPAWRLMALAETYVWYEVRIGLQADGDPRLALIAHS